jgi:hypothetical protein
MGIIQEKAKSTSINGILFINYPLVLSLSSSGGPGDSQTAQGPNCDTRLTVIRTEIQHEGFQEYDMKEKTDTAMKTTSRDNK